MPNSSSDVHLHISCNSPEHSTTTDPWSRFNHNKVIVRPRDLPRIVGLSRTSCWRLERDPNSGFPQKIRLSASACGFFLHELEAWLESRREVTHAE